MTVNKEQAEIVKRIFDEILSGKTPAMIAKELNAEKVMSKRGGRWESNVIHGMIRNEKYTGDVMLQKTFTDDRFNRHINHGEKNRYLIKNHHEAIVSHEIFEAANALVAVNSKEKGHGSGGVKYVNRYVMSGKVICGECGGKWKRVKLNRHFGFACNNHIEDKNSCSMKAIPEEPVKAAFATMMNKLTFAREQILTPYVSMMKKSRSAESFERLNELDSLLEKNAERRQQILQFFTKGLLDPAVFEAQNDDLSKEEERLCAEKDALTARVSGNLEQQEALNSLLKYTAKGRMLEGFDEKLFSEHVEHVVVLGRTEIGFAMKCGPVFRERIG